MKTPRGYYVVKCFRGISPKTGKPTGSRHRWNHGMCDYCRLWFNNCLMPINHVRAGAGTLATDKGDTINAAPSKLEGTERFP